MPKKYTDDSDPLQGYIPQKKKKVNKSSPSWLQHNRKGTPQKLGDCYPGDTVKLNGRQGSVYWTVPCFGTKAWKNNGAQCVFVRFDDDKPREGPYPFKPERPIEFVEFYKPKESK